MWKRKELKRKARKVVKVNYWAIIVVCFLLALFTGEFGTSILGLWQSDDSMDPIYVIHQQQLIQNGSIDKEIIEKAEEKVSAIKDKLNSLNDTEKKIWKVIQDNLSSLTKSQKYAFHIYDAVIAFSINQKGLGVALSIMTILSLSFTICIADPLIVGSRRYFLKVRKNENTKIGILTEIFKNKVWQNVTITMFLRGLYTFLWYFTIIGGFIKTYEYKMIPYILAENPTIKRKEAFKLSKQMMKGNKWRAFLLDISFIGWNILSVFTFGLLNLLYVNPYQVTTKAELYITLRGEAIQEKYQYYEALNDKELNDE